MQLNIFLNSNSKSEMFQYGLWFYHNTETVLVKVVDDIRINLNANKL